MVDKMVDGAEFADMSEEPESSDPAQLPNPGDRPGEAAEPDYFSQLADVKEGILEGIITTW
jgi:hypothetical protein